MIFFWIPPIKWDITHSRVCKLFKIWSHVSSHLSSPSVESEYTHRLCWAPCDWFPLSEVCMLWWCIPTRGAHIPNWAHLGCLGFDVSGFWVNTIETNWTIHIWELLLQVLKCREMTLHQLASQMWTKCTTASETARDSLLKNENLYSETITTKVLIHLTAVCWPNLSPEDDCASRFHLQCVTAHLWWDNQVATLPNICQP